eukprot:scaffold7510_cov46-Attheya_sp.AAC.4
MITKSGHTFGKSNVMGKKAKQNLILYRQIKGQTIEYFCTPAIRWHGGPNWQDENWVVNNHFLYTVFGYNFYAICTNCTIEYSSPYNNLTV